MNFLVTILQIFLSVVCLLAAAASILLFIPLRRPAQVWWLLKLYASSLSYIFVITGIVCLIAGWAIHSSFLFSIACYTMLIYSIHIYSVTREPDESSGFVKAFGTRYDSRIKPEQKKFFLSSRKIFSLPRVPDPHLMKDIPFATIAESGRILTCDLWRPPETTKPSGLALIFYTAAPFIRWIKTSVRNRSSGI